MFKQGMFRYFSPQDLVERGSSYTELSSGGDFVLGQKTATRLDMMQDQMHKNNLEKWGITPVEYMRIADMTGGLEGVHFFEYRDRKFTVIVRGHGNVDGESYSIVRTVRRGRPSKHTDLPIIDHRQFPYSIPYATV